MSVMVICVDDDAEQLENLLYNLRKHGIECRGFFDPRSALAFIENGSKADAMILDYNMSYLNGVALAKSVRRLLPSMPILFHSGLWDPGMGEIKDCLYRGKGCLTKDIVDDIRLLLGEEHDQGSVV